MKCSVCGSSDSYVKDYKHSLTVKDKKIRFTSLRRFCSGCNTILYDAKLDNDASKKL